MFSIGEFSKIAQVTPRQLRFYDEIGLLAPSFVGDGGRRYYRAAQLSHLNRILALKELGISLEQIRELLDDNLPLEELRGMLRIKRAESEQRLHDEARRHRAIETRLEQIERLGREAPIEVVLKNVPRQPWLSVRAAVASMPEALALFRRVVGTLSDSAPDRDEPFAAVLHSEAFEVDDLDLEIGRLHPVGLQPPLPTVGELRFRTSELPAIEAMATFVHQGPHDDVHLAYGALGLWLERNRYRIAGPTRELFLQLPRSTDGSDAVTEIQLPVAQLTGTEPSDSFGRRA